MVPAAASRSRNFWPAGLVAAFLLFVAGTAILIVVSARNTPELVRPDYYEQELRHQEEIERRQRTAALKDAVSVSYDPDRQTLALRLPPEHAAAQGTIELYRPSAAALDRRAPARHPWPSPARRSSARPRAA